MTAQSLPLSTIMQNPDGFQKAPKRKRLAKACDACHKSKRRCDGTAPCSNCYYASKQCTYTDASGRPVPAPRLMRNDPQSSSSPAEQRPPSSSQFASPHQLRIYPNPATTHSYQSDPSDEDKHTRKRFRNDRGNATPVEDLVIEGPIAAVTMDRPPAIDLDPALSRELTNLFFTHCHPARAIIHKPTFSADLSHNKVPRHLLLAVCALAAPLSKQPRIRTAPSRFAGKPFAQEALSLMFDGAGRLVCEADLAAAQALCILQIHDITVSQRNVPWNSRFHELALQIVEVLGVHHPEHPTLTPMPSQEFVQAATEREAIRRIFWLIHLLDVIASIWFKKPVTFSENELRLRLPVDETSFEMGVVHATLPEYLYLPAVRMKYSSEFGHLLRIVTIYAKMESALDELNESLINPASSLIEVEQKMEEWSRNLPEHLRFSHQNLELQQSMFETSSNTGAWCWCCMHVYHASCALALNLVFSDQFPIGLARHRNQRGTRPELQWAVETLEVILNLLGDRAKNSLLMGAALWSLIKYCKRDDQQVKHWAAVYEESCGTAVFELVQDWRSQSPPQQHMYPVQQAQPPPPPHTHSYQPQQPMTHRRLSDVRGSGSTQMTLPPPSTSGSRPPIQHLSETPYASSPSSGSSVTKRSPSHSPPTYALGRPPNSNGANGNVKPANRSLTLVSHPTGGHPDPSSTTNGTRDGRPGLSIGGSVGSGSTGGSGLGHGGSGNDGGSSSQTAAPYGKYGRTWTTESASEGDSKSDSAYGAATATGRKNGDVGLGQIGGMSGTGNAGSILVNGAAPTQLPSLKDSGLLNSWSEVSTRNGIEIQKTGGVQQPQPTPARRPMAAMAPPPTPTDMRSQSMPVGMAWLANESR